MFQSYWTAASETHQRESNIIIIQLNNRSVKGRSFSRKIESERSFFISEVHYMALSRRMNLSSVQLMIIMRDMYKRRLILILKREKKKMPLWSES